MKNLENDSISFTTFQKMKAAWPSEIVARSEIKQFTGGTISPGTMANLDSKGEGPFRIKIGPRIVYPIDSLLQWLEKRSK